MYGAFDKAVENAWHPYLQQDAFWVSITQMWAAY